MTILITSKSMSIRVDIDIYVEDVRKTDANRATM